MALMSIAQEIGAWWPTLAHGLEMTVLLTLASYPVALTIGLVLALPRIGRRRIRVFALTASAIVELIRGTPLLVQLFYIYYVFPFLGLRLPAFEAAVIGLAINYGAYMSEVYRGGIEAIPRAQWEAAEALGLRRWLTMRLVVLPQAIRIAIPSLGNYLVSLFKDSALASTISVSELLFSGQLLASETFKYLAIYSVIFVIYFLISYPTVLMIRAYERRLSTYVA
jgi:His/Glu/Gln/Arg/opine family amino acid ABC transporter permease subunit